MKHPHRSIHPILLSLSALASLGMVACQSDSGPVEKAGEGAGDSGEGENPTKSVDAPFANADADELFNASQVPVFQIALPPARWDHLKATATDEIYEEAQLTYEGEDVGSIGLRFKGSVGSLVACVDGNGNLTCSKLSLKLKFSEYDKDKLFFGMKRLNFHAMARDASKMRDKVAYKLYRDSGIVAPRSSWARLEVNGESLGLFALVEEVDGRFTDDRWPSDGDGNLYKEVWPISDEAAIYENGLETNEGQTEHEEYLAFRNSLYASGPEDRLEALGDWMDVDAAYAFMATSDAIAHWDGVTAFYCSEGGCSNHNFFIYQHEKLANFTMIPWDLDNTLSPSTPMDHVPHWTEKSDCSLRYPVFDGAVAVQAPGCDPLLQALASKRERYESAIDSLLKGPLQVDDLQNQVDEYAAFIRDEVEADTTIGSLQGWLSEVERLKADLAFLRERIIALRDNTPIAPLLLDPKTVATFDELGGLQLRSGLNHYSNSASTASFGLGTTMAINGSQDVRLDFVFRTEAGEPWSQWSALIFRVASNAQDMSSYSGVRFKVQADSARGVRIDLGSNAQPGEGDGARLGWGFAAGPTAATIELLFVDTAIPSWATSAGETLGEVQAAVRDLTFLPEAHRGADGQLITSDGDPGFLRIDDIEFF